LKQIVSQPQKHFDRRSKTAYNAGYHAAWEVIIWIIQNMQIVWTHGQRFTDRR
jgi:hypothetical protein